MWWQLARARLMHAGALAVILAIMYVIHCLQLAPDEAAARVETR
jgi:hypothetical protein